jgi:hypothetical protein
MEEISLRSRFSTDKLGFNTFSILAYMKFIKTTSVLLLFITFLSLINSAPALEKGGEMLQGVELPIKKT